MPPETFQQSDAPRTTAVRQRDEAAAVAEERNWDRASLVGRTITINRPRAEVFAFWRDFRNLARFMENIREVSVGDARRSHWVAAAPAGQSIEWDSEITEEEPDRLIAWRSLPGAEVRNAGRVEFLDGPPGRGCEVRVELAYEPPAGELGKLFATLFQKEPKVQARRDLRRLKQYLETGEIAVSQPPGHPVRG